MEEEGEEEGKVEKEGWEAGSLESAVHARLIGEVSLPCPPTSLFPEEHFFLFLLMLSPERKEGGWAGFGLGLGSRSGGVWGPEGNNPLRRQWLWSCQVTASPSINTSSHLCIPAQHLSLPEFQGM